MHLVIVESPNKAKTINKYLGSDYHVLASVGHVRDLPSKNGSVIPAEDFNMKYEVLDKARKNMAEISKAAAKAETIYLATDPDREGEAISWHIVEILKENKSVKNDSVFKRIAFNEVTKKAVLAAIENPRPLDINLINAQQARRALDYLVGFTLSPVLWRKLPSCKSAGRVQSVALRLICEREDEIDKFKTQEYWSVILDFLSKKNEPFSAKLTHVNQQKLEKFSINNQARASEIVEQIKQQNFFVDNIEKKQQKRNPNPPFITSSLQQEAARKLGFGSKKTMLIAQKLYEGININGENVGLITYMRTDGVTLSEDAVVNIRKLIDEMHGKKYLPAFPRVYKTKVKNAQEAHEAIRPADITLLPDFLKDKLENDFYRLYDLIWKRTVACQMENVIIDTVAVSINSKDNNFTARATGSMIIFDGFYKIYQESIDDSIEEENKLLPLLEKNDDLVMQNVKPNQHFTEPAPRFSEASLIKKLEELGIGRPSTYSAILSVLQDRQYVTLTKKRFTPEERGRLLTAFLHGFFKQYVEYDFTAALEEQLDSVAEGKLSWKELLHQFWDGFYANIQLVEQHKIIDIIQFIENVLSFHLFGEKNDKKCSECADGILNLRFSKFGAFLACNKYPECNFKKQISNSSEEGSDQDQTQVTDNNILLGQNPEGVNIYLKKGPYGWYAQLGEQPEAKGEKPKRAPLPPGAVVDQIDLAQAISLLSLPLLVGNHPKTNEEILMNIGRYGPYLKYKSKFTSIPKSIVPQDITLEQAVFLIAQEAKKVKTKVVAVKK